jgi:GWxTD domain-containing protein
MACLPVQSACTWMGLVGSLLLLAGCAMSGMTVPSQRRPYDREASTLHPNFTFHRKADAGQLDVYLSLPRKELLYSRAEASAPFVAEIEVTVADTTWLLRDTAWSDAPSILKSRWSLDQLPATPGLEVTLSDVLRNASVTSRVWLGPNGTWTPADLLIWSQREDWPLPGEDAKTGDTLIIRMPYNQVAPVDGPLIWEVQNYTPPEALPPPPFSSGRSRWDTLQPAPLGAVEADSLMILVVPNGTTVIELRNAPLTVRVHARPEAFQELREANELIAPLRFIASRSEFQKLTSAEHPKHALDAFWLACSDSPEAARDLLTTFYERVEEANLAFSGLVEGWRTDRGMIHIVFGVPQRVRRDARNEYWIYGEEGTANALTFHFRRKTYAFDGNAFELQRSIQFRSVWDRGVSNWRNGRVRGD